LPKTRCQGCLKGIETGKFDEDPRRDRYVPTWSSSRCKRNLCGRCCEDDSCAGHGTCLVCRRKKSKTVRGWCLRECLRNIRPGEPCKKLPYIYTREYDEEKLKLSRARSSLAVTPNLPYSMVAAAPPRWISQGKDGIILDGLSQAVVVVACYDRRDLKAIRYQALGQLQGQV
jgi:hypothetical protein